MAKKASGTAPQATEQTGSENNQIKFDENTKIEQVNESENGSEKEQQTDSSAPQATEQTGGSADDEEQQEPEPEMTVKQCVENAHIALSNAWEDLDKAVKLLIKSGSSVTRLRNVQKEIHELKKITQPYLEQNA